VKKCRGCGETRCALSGESRRIYMFSPNYKKDDETIRRDRDEYAEHSISLIESPRFQRSGTTAKLCEESLSTSLLLEPTSRRLTHYKIDNCGSCLCCLLIVYQQQTANVDMIAHFLLHLGWFIWMIFGGILLFVMSVQIFGRNNDGAWYSSTYMSLTTAHANECIPTAGE
jgi:uncharacterized protein with PQ loop repeat